MKAKQTIAQIFITTIMLSVLASCSSDTVQTTTESEEKPADTVPTDTETTKDDEQYPELEIKDLDGNNVNVLIRSEWDYEFIVEEETGDLVSDSIIKRNHTIEERYNCNFNFISRKGDWSNHDAFANAIHNSVLAADGAYDFVAGYQACLVTNIQNGDFLNLMDLPYLQFDAPWWAKEGLDALTINGRCYEVGGDIAVSFLEGIFCMFYNKTIAQNNDVEDLYKLVRDGKWTHDKMMSVIKGISSDIDGDSKMDKTDKFGFLTSDFYIRPYLVAYDTPTLSTDNTGDLVCIWNNNHTVSVLESLVGMAYNQDVYFADNNRTIIQDMFHSSQSLLIPSTLGTSSQLRDMDDDFGIIPYPKFDENQEKYRTTTSNEVSMISIPITAPDADKSALIIEAMCRESNMTVAPAFYEHALKGKYTRDEESAEMIDFIRSTLSFDCGWINSMIIGVSGAQYFNMVKAKDTGFASWYASQESTILSKLETFKGIYFD